MFGEKGETRLRHIYERAVNVIFISNREEETFSSSPSSFSFSLSLFFTNIFNLFYSFAFDLFCGRPSSYTGPRPHDLVVCVWDDSDEVPTMSESPVSEFPQSFSTETIEKGGERREDIDLLI